MKGWRREGKPKPEVQVLVTFTNSHKKRRYTMAMWVPKHHHENDGDFNGTSDYHEEKDLYYWPEGWYEVFYEGDIAWLISEPIEAWAIIPKFNSKTM